MTDTMKSVAEDVLAAIFGTAIDSTPSVAPPRFDALHQYLYARIDAHARPEHGDPSERHAQQTTHPAQIAWTSLHGTVARGGTVPIAFVAAYDSREGLNCYLGASPAVCRDSAVLAGCFASAYRGVRYTSETTQSRVGSGAVNAMGDCAHWVALNGVPPLASGENGDGVIDRVCRGMGDRPWVLVVEATPASPAQVYSVMREYDTVATTLRAHESETRALGGLTAQLTDATVTRAIQAVDGAIELMQEAATQGPWLTRVHVGANSEADALAAGALFAGSSSTDVRALRPMRATPCVRGAKSLTDAWIRPIRIQAAPGSAPGSGQSFPLGGGRLASLASLPDREYRGLELNTLADFDISLPTQTARDTFVLGRSVRDTLRPRATTSSLAEEELRLSVPELSRHVLVSGVTGSGKSVTATALLRQVAAAKIPFLVIEPAKSEYARGLGGIAGLQRFTAGDPSSGLRINPFEASPGVRIQTHLDNIKALFNASFVMYSPMPQVLEMCLNEIYSDQGWDLAFNLNRRLAQHDSQPEALRQLLFPTLADLDEKVVEVVDRLGYDSEITMNVQAALHTRINSLRLGSKGLLLDGPSTVTMHELLGQPTVIELELIGDDEEKCFIMGLLFLNLYEYRVAENARDGAPGESLRHFVLIEEAHRLLRATPPSTDPESANGRGKAVEDFCNMLAEVRAYGQGFGICEQIPTKLAPDVLKNTNIKIIHRLLARDDRESVATCTCMTDAQRDVLPTLRPGRAVVFTEGMDAPVLLDMPSPPMKSASPARSSKSPITLSALSDDQTMLATYIRGWFVEELLFPQGAIPPRLVRVFGPGVDAKVLSSALRWCTSYWCRSYRIPAKDELQILKKSDNATRTSGATVPAAQAAAAVRLIAEELWSVLKKATHQPYDLCANNCANLCLVRPLAQAISPSARKAIRAFAIADNAATPHDMARVLGSELRRLAGVITGDARAQVARCAIIQATWEAGITRAAADSHAYQAGEILRKG